MSAKRPRRKDPKAKAVPYGPKNGVPFPDFTVQYTPEGVKTNLKLKLQEWSIALKAKP